LVVWLRFTVPAHKYAPGSYYHRFASSRTALDYITTTRFHTTPLRLVLPYTVLHTYPHAALVWLHCRCWIAVTYGCGLHAFMRWFLVRFGITGCTYTVWLVAGLLQLCVLILRAWLRTFLRCVVLGSVRTWFSVYAHRRLPFTTHGVAWVATATRVRRTLHGYNAVVAATAPTHHTCAPVLPTPALPRLVPVVAAFAFPAHHGSHVADFICRGLPWIARSPFCCRVLRVRAVVVLGFVPHFTVATYRTHLPQFIRLPRCAFTGATPRIPSHGYRVYGCPVVTGLPLADYVGCGFTFATTPRCALGYAHTGCTLYAVPGSVLRVAICRQFPHCRSPRIPRLVYSSSPVLPWFGLPCTTVYAARRAPAFALPLRCPHPAATVHVARLPRSRTVLCWTVVQVCRTFPGYLLRMRCAALPVCVLVPRLVGSHTRGYRLWFTGWLPTTRRMPCAVTYGSVHPCPRYHRTTTHPGLPTVGLPPVAYHGLLPRPLPRFLRYRTFLPPTVLYCLVLFPVAARWFCAVTHSPFRIWLVHLDAHQFFDFGFIWIACTSSFCLDSYPSSHLCGSRLPTLLVRTFWFLTCAVPVRGWLFALRQQTHLPSVLFGLPYVRCTTPRLRLLRPYLTGCACGWFGFLYIRFWVTD